MRISDFNRPAALSFFVAATILAGCGGGQTVPQGTEPIMLHPTMIRSTFLAAGPSSQDLLYIENRNRSAMYVYSYPQGKRQHRFKGQLALLYNDCADSSGRVYVLNYFGSTEAEILVYAHGATHPMRRIYPLGGILIDCASDPTTGNLAVVVYYPPVQIVFPHAKGSAKGYSYPNNFTPDANTYDDKGNLFVTGFYGSSFAASLLELPKGSSTFVAITTPPISVYDGGGVVRWDGKHLALGNGAASIYRLAIRGTSAGTIGVIHLDHASVGDFWIQGGTLVGANSAEPNVMIWNYPRGGRPRKVLHSVGEEDAVTVSVAPSH